ncbi:MAG: MFS transporter [Actinomycetes bacterium]
MRTFYQLLVNTLCVSVINYTVWFAITFYTYLETRSVFATGMVAGIFLVATALTGIWFGSLVDHHPKKLVMQGSSMVSLLLYVVAFGIYQLTPEERFRSPASVVLWLFIVCLMIGVIAGNIRSIALLTLVTALIEEGRRDRANGLVGTTSGVSFLVTSVISGLLVGVSGMFWVLVLAMAVLVLAVVHLALVPVPEREAATVAEAVGNQPTPVPRAKRRPPRRSRRAARSTSAAPCGSSAACRVYSPWWSSAHSTTSWAGSSWR